MRFIKINNRIINLDNVNEINIREDRIGIRRMDIRLIDRSVRLNPEETSGLETWLERNDLFEEVRQGYIRYPSIDEIERRIQQIRQA